jgi:hypothetical protein
MLRCGGSEARRVIADTVLDCIAQGDQLFTIRQDDGNVEGCRLMVRSMPPALVVEFGLESARDPETRNA